MELMNHYLTSRESSEYPRGSSNSALIAMILVSVFMCIFVLCCCLVVCRWSSGLATQSTIIFDNTNASTTLNSYPQHNSLPRAISVPSASASQSATRAIINTAPSSFSQTLQHNNDFRRDIVIPMHNASREGAATVEPPEQTDNEKEQRRILIKQSLIVISPSKEFQNDEYCPICMENMSAKTPNCMFYCGHAGHDACIKSWLIKTNVFQCPICRHSLDPVLCPDES